MQVHGSSMPHVNKRVSIISQQRLFGCCLGAQILQEVSDTVIILHYGMAALKRDFDISQS